MKNTNKNSSLMRAVLSGLILGPSIMLITSVILAFAIMKASNLTGYVFLMALTAVFVGGFISALRAARAYKDSPFQAGLLTGLANLGIIVIVSLISSSYTGGIWKVLLPPVILMLASLMGTLTAIRIKPSSKRRLKKLRKQTR